MSVEVGWMQPQAIIFIRFWGDVTLADVHRANVDAVALSRDLRHTPHLIVDMSHIDSYPTNIIQIREVVTEFVAVPLGWLVLIIRSDMLLQFVLSVLARLYANNQRWRIFHTMDEAETFLARQRRLSAGEA